MKSIGSNYWAGIVSSFVIGLIGLTLNNAQAQYEVSVQRTGPENIYKGFCGADITAFTISVPTGPYNGDLEVYFFLGGTASVVSPDTDPCDALRGVDFEIVDSPEVEEYTTVPNLYAVTIPETAGSVTFYVKTINSSSECTSGYQIMNLAIPEDEEYTEGNYTVNPEAGTSSANIHPPPEITLTVAPDSFPPTFHKESSPQSISFTITASSAPPADMFVTFLVGGDGTAFNPEEPDPCYAYYQTDFTVSGASKAPFPNGFYFTLPANQTSKTFTVTAAGSGCECGEGFQTLLVTVPEPPACSNYSPASSSAQTSADLYPD